MQYPPSPSDSFIRERQLIAELLPVAHSTLWQMVNDGRFPKPIKLSPRLIVWSRAEVSAWIEAQILAKKEAQ